jgi:hypothetical protein
MKRLLHRIKLLPTAVEALFWLVIAWLTLDVLPGKLYRKLIPSFQQPEDIEAGRGEISANSSTAVLIRRTSSIIRKVSDRMPVRSVCFHHGIAAYWMMRRRGIVCTLHYGVAKKDGGELESHVWATYCGRDVIGGPASEGFTEIAVMQD